MTDLHIRYFAAASEAAGASEQTVPVREGEQLATVLQRVAKDNAELQRVLKLCSFLSDGKRVDRQSTVDPTYPLDVLPPFAGG
ncbi:MoaD/ThiS family protein [Gleimia hominis]|uniref:MoaD/ThiS family protein n=1 Tax=Gleimia hominis TaxID=595468 RepID=UPI000C7FFECF|nr:MoaD/ThiS family protein [Gleimia hominis]WIK64804.1 MoaD/ThiS family protein [Gleimia hominis]